MRASIRDIVNTDVSKGRSFTPSPNSLRDFSIHSDTSSQIYANKIKVENIKLNWAEQVESQNFHLSYQSNQQDVKIIRSRLCLFYFSFSFLFFFGFTFIFLFLEQLGLGSEVIGHTVTSVTI